jgi:hypothetical protein
MESRNFEGCSVGKVGRFGAFENSIDKMGTTPRQGADASL